MIRFLLRPIYHFFQRPSVRASRIFTALRKTFHSPREMMIENALDFIKQSSVEGDYLEFGLYAGRGFAAAFNIAKAMGIDGMKFYGFDSFEGLPEIGGVDAEGHKHFEEGQYTYDLETFKRKMKKEGLDFSSNKVNIIPGWFSETLTPKTKKQLPLKKAAVVWIDCDLYESTVPVLNFITDYLQEGTVIVFDDWFCFRANPNRGEQRAFREWLRKNPSIKLVEYLTYNWGKSFIVLKGRRSTE